jgi:HNH endonuclease
LITTLSSNPRSAIAVSPQREAAADVGFYTERNKWIIAWAIAIPCGILLPVVGLFVIFLVLLVIQPTWDRKRESRLAAFDRTHTPPPRFNRTESSQNYTPEPVVTLHPDCSAPTLIGIGYDRGFILRRDDFTCQSCGCRFSSADLEVHHVLPREQLGSDSIRNLITLCKNCHFHEDWFDHVHKNNQQRISQKRTETFNLLHKGFLRRNAYPHT